jgi:hypothetical protein
MAFLRGAEELELDWEAEVVEQGWFLPLGPYIHKMDPGRASV